MQLVDGIKSILGYINLEFKRVSPELPLPTFYQSPPISQFCQNSSQCSTHGTCMSSYCKCSTGYYGIRCQFTTSTVTSSINSYFLQQVQLVYQANKLGSQKPETSADFTYLTQIYMTLSHTFTQVEYSVFNVFISQFSALMAWNLTLSQYSNLYQASQYLSENALQNSKMSAVEKMASSLSSLNVKNQIQKYIVSQFHQK